MTFQCSLEELYRHDKWQPISLIYRRDRSTFTPSHPVGTVPSGRSTRAHFAAAPGHPFLRPSLCCFPIAVGFSSWTNPGSVCIWLMDLGVVQQTRKWGFSAIWRAGIWHGHANTGNSCPPEHHVLVNQPEQTMAWHGKSRGTKRRQQQGKAMKWNWYFIWVFEEKQHMASVLKFSRSTKPCR